MANFNPQIKEHSNASKISNFKNAGFYQASIDHDQKDPLSIAYRTPKGQDWEYVGFKVFRVRAGTTGSGSANGALSAKWDIMDKYFSGNSVAALAAYNAWTTSYNGQGGKRIFQAISVKHDLLENYLEIEILDNKNSSGNPKVYDVILHLKDDAGNDVFVDPPVRNEY
ncbi:MAG: hypothetical protein QGG02_11425 [Gammaproteobacteria bacterium]|nr:hypothetical protein [Gammaproteobacteria bacterium]MDP6731590.1 hypothetical protein [Gammaproteobacteria bacterium]